MKNLVKKIAAIVLCFSMLFGNVAITHAEELDPRVELIYSYQDFVNQKDLNNYISLFDSATQEWMNQFKDDPGFFLGEKVNIEQVKLLSYETGLKAAYIENNEFGNNEISVYYVQAVCDTSEVTSENIKPLNGDISYVFVFVKEDNAWKIGRVSIADVNQIALAGEGFGNDAEDTALVNERIAMARASLSQPSSICIKMTKKANTDYWGKTYVDVPFKEYILNVVPNEYVVSYGGEYLKAGTMAVKMFGWYYTIHKKYPNSPGGCDLQDTSADQNYLAGSYDALGTYKSTLDKAYSAIESEALVNNSGTIFCTQYVAGKTNSTTGILGAETAYSLSKDGKTYLQILQNAYNNSTNAGNQTVKIVTY